MKRRQPPGRPDGVPEILVHIVEGRSVDSKKALMRDITEAVVKNFAVPAVPAERVVVQIVESPKSDKMRGGVAFDEM